MSTPRPADRRREEIVFDAARQLATPEDQAAYLQLACGSDTALRQRIEARLQQQAQTPDASQAATLAESKSGPDGLQAEGPGSVIGRYKLLEEVGEGGYGTVYVAEQTEPVFRRVALKLIKLGLDTKEVVARFEAERQALAMMDHPHIATVFDGGTTETGRPYFVMELVRGTRITDYCEQNHLGMQERLDLFIKVCQAIQHAHQKGIIHRDIKPSNILVTQQDGVAVPKVIDFGIAKATAGRLTDATLYTRWHQFIGTPAYMSPEQAELGGMDIDTRSDLYSLGVLLYELLTGQTPFEAKELVAAGLDGMRRIIREKDPVRPSTRLRQTTSSSTSPSLSTLHSSLTTDLDWIVMKCLEKDRTRRYETANGLATDIQRHLSHEPVQARPPSVGYKLQKAWRRNRLLISAGAVVVGALVVALAVSLWQASVAREARKARVQLAYVSDMDLASRAFADDNLGRAQELLDRYVPSGKSAATKDPPRSTLNSQTSTDLRGWEWCYFWERTRSQAAFRFCSHPKRLASLAFSGAGDRLVVHEFLGATVLYDVNTWKPLPGLVRTNVSMRVGFCASNDLVAFDVETSTSLLQFDVQVWDSRRNALVSRLDFRKQYFSSFAFSQDGQRLAGFGEDTACIWDMASGQLITRIPIEGVSLGGPMFGAIAFTRAGDVVVVGHHNGMIRMHEVPSGRPLPEKEFRMSNDPIITLVLSPDGRWLAASGLSPNASTVRVWELSSGKARELPGQRWCAFVLAFDSRSRMLAAGDGQSIRLWDLAEWRPLAKLPGHRLSVTALAFSPDGHWLASGSTASGTTDSEVLFWDVDRVSRELRPDYQAFTIASKVAFAPDSKSFLALDGGVVTRFDAMTLQALGPLPGYGSSNTQLTVSWDNRWLATADREGVVHFWNHDTHQEQGSFRPYADQKEVSSLAILGNGKVLSTAIVMNKPPLRLWDTATWQEPEPWRTLNRQRELENVASATTTRDGQFLATGLPDGRVMLWETGGGRRLFSFRGHRQMVMEVAFSPDGRWLASAGWDGSLKLWDVAGRREAGTFGGERAPCFGVAFSPDGRRLLSSDVANDTPVVVWDVATRQHLIDLTVRGSAPFRHSPQFSPDGRMMTVAALNEGVTYFWRAPSWAEIEAAEKDTPRLP